MIRLIELFAGYGSQHLALKYLNIPCESWKICEWAVKSIQAYKDLHFTDDNTKYSENLSKEQLIEYLFNKGISSDYNKPMSITQIKRLGEEKCRKIYDNIIATHNLVNIQNVKAEDLDIVDRDKYKYIMTYSFPCQDLSLAGKCAGMNKKDKTRSGLLWEVERLLYECNGNLPHILLMENVPLVHGKKNINDFNNWIKTLEKLGYSNFYKDLNACDYEIPQTRKRCFVVSVLNGSYEFPNSKELKIKLKDILEDVVDESYYLSAKQINIIKNWNSYQNPINTLGKPLCQTLTTRCGYSASMILTSNKDIETEKQIRDSILAIELNDELYPIAKNYKNYIQIAREGKRDIDNRIWKDVSPTLTTNCGNAKIFDEDLRIRTLTPRECFRLMGVKDTDFDKISKNQTKASLYHLAGDSIVVNVLMSIFSNMRDIRNA